VYVDDSGALLLMAEPGIGVLLDRDLSAFIERLADPLGRSAERLLEDVASGQEARAVLRGASVRLAPVRAAEVPRIFGFVQRPAPPAGEPDCT
jgi:hypothetical protein